MSANTATISKGHYFFVAMAILFPILAAWGFIPSYTAMNAGEFNIHWLAHVHGALMTSWLLLYIAQTVLAARGNFAFHRRLGLFGLALGILIWISMAAVSARALIGYPTPLDSFLFDVLLVQFYGMAVFGLFFTWGMLARKKTEDHKRLMLLATLVLNQAALDRMPFLRGGWWSNFIAMDLLLLPLFIYDWLNLRRIHRITWTGLLVYITAQAIVVVSWGSPAWHQWWFHFIGTFK